VLTAKPLDGKFRETIGWDIPGWVLAVEVFWKALKALKKA
jgi:hypothetical protein